MISKRDNFKYSFKGGIMKKFTYAFVACIAACFLLGAVTVQAQTQLQDFSSYTAGDSLDYIAWSRGAMLPAIVDSSGNNVLQNTIHNYNSAPVLRFVLPSGRTLADYDRFTFKAYFAQGDVGYKNIVVEAYQTMPTGQAYNVAANQIGSWNRAQNGSTAWENISVNILNARSYTDTVYIAFGINCAGTGDIGGTGVTTIWYADDVALSTSDTTFVNKWGFLGGRIGNWKFTPGSSSGSGSIGGDTVLGVEWGAIRGQFYSPVTPTTSQALVVTGKIEFVGSGIDTWSGLRYGVFLHDSAGTLITSNVDSARWSGSEAYSHGYMFTPVSGTNRATDGVSGGLGTNWIRVSGNYISTSSGSGPIYFAGYNKQKPARAVADTGKYEFAFSIQPLANGTKEVRFYLIKGSAAQSTESKYYFGGSFIDTSSVTTSTFNGVVFAVHAGGSGTNPNLRGVKLTDVKAQLGTPFAIPEAPWQAYYVDQWGFLGGRIGNWHFIPDPEKVIGNAGIGGDTVLGVEWGAIRGEFVEPVTATTAKALIVTGKVEFVGAGIDTWSGLRYGVFLHDSAGTLITSNVDSARWSGSEAYSHGYMFTPVSGTNRATDGVSGGLGTNWIRVSGNYISTSSGSGPIRFAGWSKQKPARAVADAGKYDFAFSVQPLANGTKEVRFYLIKEKGTAAQTTYYFGGSFIDTTTIAPTFNGVVLAVHAGGSGANPNLREVLLTDVKVDIGVPITVPVPPWSAYYVSDWGFIGDQFGGWHYVPDPEAIVGNAGMGADAANTGTAALRGGFFETVDPSTYGTGKALLVTGKMALAGGGFATPGSLRIGVYNTDAAGSLVIDTATATLPDSTRWTGTEGNATGYLFIPPSVAGAAVDFDFGTGTWGGVVDGSWRVPQSNSYSLGNVQAAPGSVPGAGTYDFAVSIEPTANGNDVRFKLSTADNSYSWEYGKMDDNALATKTFNSFGIALNAGNAATGITLTDVKVDLGPGISVGVETSEPLLPKVYAISQNYPNPFNPSTMIKYDLPMNSHVTLVVYDILGRAVAKLVDGIQQANSYAIQWNAASMSTGVYFLRIDARSLDGSKDFTAIKKLLLMK
jgi:hypothetical protein